MCTWVKYIVTLCGIYAILSHTYYLQLSCSIQFSRSIDSYASLHVDIERERERPTCRFSSLVNKSPSLFYGIAFAFKGGYIEKRFLSIALAHSLARVCFSLFFTGEYLSLVDWYLRSSEVERREREKSSVCVCTVQCAVLSIKHADR